MLLAAVRRLRMQVRHQMTREGIHLDFGNEDTVVFSFRDFRVDVRPGNCVNESAIRFSEFIADDFDIHSTHEIS